MAKVDFELTLQGEDQIEEHARFAPGSELQGTVVVYPDEDVNCKHLFARLVWHTAGRGTRYSETAVETDLYQGTLMGGMPRAFDFSFALPRQPWSYEGHYVSIVWKVQIQIDVPWATDPKTEQAFVLRSSPP